MVQHRSALLPYKKLKKVLIITYYWPPAGGPGVQRVLKFAKYLPEFGWQPIILTVKTGEFPAIDKTLEKDIPKECIVYKTNSWEPTSLYKNFAGMKKDEKIPVAVLSEKNLNWKKQIANWIRLNLFIPDAKIGWIPFAVKKGRKIIKKHQPDVIFSSSPPPTVHLIAKKLAKWSGTKWVADFRDPWTDIYHLDGLTLANHARYKNLKQEKIVLSALDGMITVSTGVAQLLALKTAKPLKYQVIPNGFDETDFEYLKEKPNPRFFQIAYAGKINTQQNPSVLWKVLRNRLNENANFQNSLKITLIGNIAPYVVKDLTDNGLEQYVEMPGYLPHPETLKRLSTADILLLLIPNTRKNRGILTGKLLEYLALKRFILGFGPIDGEAAHILRTTGCGKMIDYSDLKQTESLINDLISNWKKGIRRTVSVQDQEIKKYSRRALTADLVGFFNEINES